MVWEYMRVNPKYTMNLFCKTIDTIFLMKHSSIAVTLGGYKQPLWGLPTFNGGCTTSGSCVQALYRLYRGVHLFWDPHRGFQTSAELCIPATVFSEFAKLYRDLETSARLLHTLQRYADHLQPLWSFHTFANLRGGFQPSQRFYCDLYFMSTKTFRQVSCALYLRKICMSYTFVCMSVCGCTMNSLTVVGPDTSVEVYMPPDVCIPPATSASALHLYTEFQTRICAYAFLCVCRPSYNLWRYAYLMRILTFWFELKPTMTKLHFWFQLTFCSRTLNFCSISQPISRIEFFSTDILITKVNFWLQLMLNEKLHFRLQLPPPYKQNVFLL